MLRISRRRRIQWIELHDQPWYPDSVRRLVTDFLRFAWTFPLPFGSYKSPAALPAEDLCGHLTDGEHAVDVCSGGGGPVATVQKLLARQGINVRWTLTDLFPNETAFQLLCKDNSELNYVVESVDATSCELKGFRTMFASFHHFPPELGVRLLADAVSKDQPIGIFEFQKNSLAACLLFAIQLPIFSLLGTPFLRPFSYRRLFFTYIIPIVPFTLTVDGIISCLRTYSEGEFRELVGQADPTSKFVWTYRQQRLIPFLPLYYLAYIGVPRGKAG